MSSVQLKSILINKISESLKSELANLSNDVNLKKRLEQVRELIQKYNEYPSQLLSPGDNIREGSIVLVVEQWWHGPVERWYFIGFGGELSVECSGRVFHIVPLKHFQGLNVGEAYQTNEGRPGEEMLLSHKVVYVI